MPASSGSGTSNTTTSTASESAVPECKVPELRFCEVPGLVYSAGTLAGACRWPEGAAGACAAAFDAVSRPGDAAGRASGAVSRRCDAASALAAFEEHRGQRGHADGGPLADVGVRIADRGGVGLARVDQVDGDVGAHVAHQGGGGVDRERRADHDEEIGRGGDAHRRVEQGNRLAEEDDVGPQQGAVGRRGVERLLPALDRHDEVGIALGAQPGQFAVEVRDARRAGPFVEVVHVLRDDLHVVRALQLRDGPVSCVGGCGEHFASAHVVETYDRGAVACQRFGGADILDAVVGPQAVGVAEGGQSAVGAHAGAGEDNDLFHNLGALRTPRSRLRRSERGLDGALSRQI